MKQTLRVFFIAICFLSSIAGLAQDVVAEIQVIKQSGDQVIGLSGSQVPVPVRVDLSSGLIPQGSLFQLYEVVGDERIKLSSQIRYGESDELSFVLDSSNTHIRKFVLFKVETLHARSLQSEMSATINDSTIQISKNQNSILHYRYSELPPPPGQADKWARSGFIHPLYSPSGEELTWVQPADHIHHMGLWNPWTRVTWQGNKTDFWNLGDEQGTVRFKNIIATESGDVYAEFRVVQDHVAFLKQSDTDERTDHVVMSEEWLVRVWNITDGFLIDFTSIITNITEDTVSLDAYRYGGGIGYRATEKWNNTNSKVLTSEGKTWENGDASRANWCRISGELNGTETGLLFMSDPSNYDSPQAMRIWPNNSNGGVGHQFFEFTPIREKAWILESGKSYSQRYRIWVQEGQMSPLIAEAAWQAYANHSEIRISYIQR